MMLKTLPIVFLFAYARTQELKNATACSEELLQLECAQDEVIAVHNAYFDGNDFSGCGMMLPISITPLIDNRAVANAEIRRFSVQSTVNKRCGGVNKCLLLLNDDEPQATTWGNGKLHVHYYCIASKAARYSCGSVIEIATPEKGDANDVLRPTRPPWFPGPVPVSGWGYIRNNGYPEYYRGVHDCTWTIRATQGRRVLLTLLDLSIRSVLHGEAACKDYLSVTEGSRLLMNKCGEIEEPIVIESSDNELNVTLSVKSEFYSKRGLLAHFTAVGCPIPKHPKQGYLVHGNTSHAEFMCCVDHVFPDTGFRFKNLTCQQGYRWSEDLPDCVEIQHIVDSGNSSLLQILRQAQQNTTEPKVGELTNFNSKNFSLTFDFVVPSSIIGGLIVGNIFIALALMRCRRNRKKQEAAAANAKAIPGPGTSQQGQQLGTPV